jgi:stage II sporulation protein E
VSLCDFGVNDCRKIYTIYQRVATNFLLDLPHNKETNERVRGAYRMEIVKKLGNEWKQRILNHAWVHTMMNMRWQALIAAVAFLLGRATILDQIAPFALAFFTTIYYLRPSSLRVTAVSLIAGSLFAAQPQTGLIVAQMVMITLLMRGWARYEKTSVAHAPILVFVTATSVGIFADLLQAAVSWISIAMTSVESILSSILTMIFLQAIPVFTVSRKSAQVRNEELICVIILFASVLTGMSLWQMEGITFDHIFSRYLILLLAFVGGAAIGTSVGVIAGLILSLANIAAIPQISLLALAGLLAGLLKQGGKGAVAFGMILGTSILSVYAGNPAAIIQSSWESAVAILLFLFTPSGIIRTLSKFTPGTVEHTHSQQEYARRIRDVTAHRVTQFSDVFRQLSQSFGQLVEKNQAKKFEEDVGYFVNAVTSRACKTCFRKETCWDKHFYRTSKYMTEMMSTVEANPEFSQSGIPAEWKRICHKTDRVLAILKKQYELFRYDQHWVKQIHESRKLVSEQLQGVSQVMDDLAKEIRREGQEMYRQEEQIKSVLEEIGLPVHHIDIVSLADGNIEIEMIHGFPKGFDECSKVIAPLLTNILGETVAVKRETWGVPDEGLATVTFTSAKEFEIETGVACLAKGGEWLSGDSYSTAELGNGKFAVALSDGMGNGERARAESSAALSILQQLLQSGMEEHLAIKSVNSVLMLRSPDEMYATIDLAMIDLYNAKATFMKIGSTPSFIKRRNEIIPITGHNLPIGILKDIEVDMIHVQLQPGDVLVMMTDGVYDAPGHAINKELWMKRLLHEMKAESAQEVADAILERVILLYSGEITDDLTVMVAKIEQFRPEWATFRWNGLQLLERPRVVS